MIETALKGNSKYWGWIIILLAIMGLGGGAYLSQLSDGLTITGMNRDVSWGFYIAQFTYMVGVAAAAVMLVLPYYFHNYKAFKNMIILAEFQAIAAVIVCLGFIVVDIGYPQRMLNIIFHPTPNSILFWDMIVLNGYLFINLLVAWVTLQAQRNNVAPPKWIYFFIYLSIIWAVSIHTVTAFLYQGLPGRHFWLTAVLAPRFLASAFCSGPAILLLVGMLLEKISTFRVGEEAKKTMAKIITYAMAANVFLFLMEVFTGFYSNIPGHKHSIEFLFGLHGHGNYVSNLMWIAVVLGLGSLAYLVVPKLRENHKTLPYALIALVLATWIDKGIGLLIGGFTPNPFETVTEYAPTAPELMISFAIYAMGALVLTILYKVALTVKKETGEIS